MALSAPQYLILLVLAGGDDPLEDDEGEPRTTKADRSFFSADTSVHLFVALYNQEEEATAGLTPWRMQGTRGNQRGTALGQM